MLLVALDASLELQLHPLTVQKGSLEEDGTLGSLPSACTSTKIRDVTHIVTCFQKVYSQLEVTLYNNYG